MPDTDDELLNSSDDNDDLHETYCLGQSMPTQSQTQGSHLSQDVPSEAHRSLRYRFFSSRCAFSSCDKAIANATHAMGSNMVVGGCLDFMGLMKDEGTSIFLAFWLVWRDCVFLYMQA